MSKLSQAYPEATFPRIYKAAHTVVERREIKKRDFKVRYADILPPIGKAALIGFDHREASDARTSATAVDRAVYLAAKDTLWKAQYFYAGYLLQLICAFPLNREKLGHSTIKRSKEILEQGRIIGAFEEGTRFELDDKGEYKLDEHGKKIVLGDTIAELKPLLPYLAIKFNIPLFSGGISHLTPEEVKEYGRDVKRVVFKGPDLPDPELKARQAIEDLTERHTITMQSAFDEAQDWARADAAKAASK